MNTVNMVKREVETRMTEVDKKQAAVDNLIRETVERIEDSHITYRTTGRKQHER